LRGGREKNKNNTAMLKRSDGKTASNWYGLLMTTDELTLIEE
jgi:hypothetical protein